MTGFVVIMWFALAIIPASIASKKGRSFFLWYIYGFFLFIIALIHAICIKPDDVAILQKDQSLKKCPYCAELIKKEAVVCRYCGRNLPQAQPEKQDEYEEPSDYIKQINKYREEHMNK